MEFPSVDEVVSDIESKAQAQSEPQEQQSQAQETQQSEAPSAEKEKLVEQVSAVMDLTKAEKIRLGDEEIPVEELKKMLLRHADYTRKTQQVSAEKKAMEEDRKYSDNLRADLMAVRSNPSLMAQFKQVYPEKYHHYLDLVYSGDNSPSKEKQAIPEELQNYLKPLQERLDKLTERERSRDEAEHNAKVEKDIAFLETNFSKYSAQFPKAHNDLVLFRLNSMLQSGQEINEKAIEATFKSVDKEMGDHYKRHYSDEVKKQTAANEKGKDTKQGGGIAGQAPRTLRTFKEAADAWTSDLNRK